MGTKTGISSFSAQKSSVELFPGSIYQKLPSHQFDHFYQSVQLHDFSLVSEWSIIILLSDWLVRLSALQDLLALWRMLLSDWLVPSFLWPIGPFEQQIQPFLFRILPSDWLVLFFD